MRPSVLTLWTLLLAVAIVCGAPQFEAQEAIADEDAPLFEEEMQTSLKEGQESDLAFDADYDAAEAAALMPLERKERKVDVNLDIGVKAGGGGGGGGKKKKGR